MAWGGGLGTKNAALFYWLFVHLVGWLGFFVYAVFCVEYLRVVPWMLMARWPTPELGGTTPIIWNPAAMFY